MTLLTVNNLSTSFYTRNGLTKAVEDVSFSLDAGETLAIVGESGSGKSVSCYSIMGLIPCPPGKIESGSAVFDGVDLLNCSDDEIRAVRGNKIAMIFQDPMTCLNPYLTVGEQLIEPLIYHHKVSRSEAKKKAIELMTEVGIRSPETNFNAWPHEFSGGMRQRVMIAMALIAEPKLLIADEPTTALDVTIQKQILDLVAEIQKKRDLGIIFISHDLGVVKNLADKVLVMKTGHIVEQGNAQDVLENPQHEYTQKLLAAIPKGAKENPKAEENPEPLIQVKNLVTEFNVNGNRFRAVDNVNFDILPKEILGLVGESGSGKSTIGRSILRLVDAQGSVNYRGDELLSKNPQQMKPLRRKMQMIFQDPYASLNPRMTIYETLAEPMKLHGIAKGSELNQAVLKLMDDVGLARAFVKKYPHEFSGGQRQRIAIGRAIATKPEFIVADEPVSALDVTIQKQILELIQYLVDKHELSMLFISHDLAVVRKLCDRVIVLKHGELVESGNVEALWQQPSHVYTQSLLAAAMH
ncbi:ABC transporter ATP-binding protein [Sessilibacter corallicola]|uniref:ABC transporter ATP-binding protein n=1 Tax=Sessilibacter corallicola TaxID=2904075 RepID=UPI001E3266D2|nr:dipeptide ABC transporter ATP-binding protein [Sessilibacter corallicola]MCE2028242.1 dipeptide ABC transporter ATP-binding protein [Sessilibacter corallicola]